MLFCVANVILVSPARRALKCVPECDADTSFFRPLLAVLFPIYSQGAKQNRNTMKPAGGDMNPPKCSVKLSVPFESNQLAQIAKNSIDADEVPNPDLIVRVIQVEGNNLDASIVCEDLFKLRTSLNNYIESVLQVQKTIKRFNYDNYGVH